MTDNTYDVLVVGGGAAGLAGALALARSRRSVLVVDAGDPRNAAADHVHNYLGREGATPADLYATGRAEIEQYGAQVRRGRVVAATPWAGPATGSTATGSTATGSTATGFTATLEDGEQVQARRLLVTTGATDRLPSTPGLAERWGRDVLHCPYCHGWEVRDRAIGVLASTPMAAHQALLFRQLSDDVVVLLDGGDHLTEADRLRLAARGVRVVAAPVTEVVVEDDRLVGVRLESGDVVARDALVVASYVEARSELLASLGAEVAPLEMGGIELGTQVVVDATGRTTVPGVWAAGNVAVLNAQVITSAAAGLWAGAQVNMDLVDEEATAAVAAWEEAS